MFLGRSRQIAATSSSQEEGREKEEEGGTQETSCKKVLVGYFKRFVYTSTPIVLTQKHFPPDALSPSLKTKKTQNATSLATCIQRVSSYLVEVVALLTIAETRARHIIRRDTRVISVTNPRVIQTARLTVAVQTRVIDSERIVAGD